MRVIGLVLAVLALVACAAGGGSLGNNCRVERQETDDRESPQLRCG